MALRDIFKKKKKVNEDSPYLPPRPASQSSAKEVKSVEKPKEEKKPPELRTPAVKRTPQVKKGVRSNEAWRVLKTPHVTEKATDLTKKNQYVFKVFSRTNKVEIRKAVENLYGVDVVSVKIINILPKKRRLGRTEGWKSGYKKAIIRIKEGQKIEVLPR